MTVQIHPTKPATRKIWIETEARVAAKAKAKAKAKEETEIESNLEGKILITNQQPL